MRTSHGKPCERSHSELDLDIWGPASPLYKVKPDSVRPDVSEEMTAPLFKHLASAWKDEHLGFRATTWPVPTRLARLAAKRAMLHIRTDEAKQSEVVKRIVGYGNQDLTETLSKAISFPKVPSDLGKILYYL